MENFVDSQQINRFPLPLQGRAGWPWLEKSAQIAPAMTDEKYWPKISIVTPSLNQGQFLEETILSVLKQGYPNLEYIIIDGGSTDESVEIIKKYEQHLAYWVSEPDRGQAHALNKGFDRTSGDWLAWINSDDYYMPRTLFRVASSVADNPGTDWIVGTTVVINNEYQELERFVPRSSGRQWTDYVCIRQSGTDLPQPSSFWSRGAWLAAGRLDESFRYTMDHEYWGRLARSGYYPLCLVEALAVFRRHEESKTSEGYIPFLREETRVIDKWLPQATLQEKDILFNCRQFLMDEINNIERGLLISRIHQSVLAPLRYMNSIFQLISNLFRKVFYRIIPSYRRQYWEGRAVDIDEKWGQGEGDYPVLAEVIASVRPKSILDVGCGSGRLFPLYDQLHIPEVVGQDISEEALRIAAARHPFANISSTSLDIFSLDYSVGHFDLIISNRVLQHVQPEAIWRVLAKLASLGKSLYLNELTDSDGLEETYYMFRHDYRALLERHGFAVVSSGSIGKQVWSLFTKLPQSSE